MPTSVCGTLLCKDNCTWTIVSSWYLLFVHIAHPCTAGLLCTKVGEGDIDVCAHTCMCMWY